MKKNVLLCFLLLLLAGSAFAQQKIKDGTVVGNSLPNKDALLELESNNKGILLTRVALIQSLNFAPLTSHVAGMMVYNTATINDVVPGVYYNDGSKWVFVKSSSGSLLVESEVGKSGAPGIPGTAGGPGPGTNIVTNDSGTWVFNSATNTWSNISGAKGVDGVGGMINADNGLTKSGLGTVAAPYHITLGGALLSPTIIETTPTNTLSLTGLQSGLTSDKIIVTDANGVLKVINSSSLVPNTTVSNTLTGKDLSTTVNGVTSTVDLTSAVAAATTNVASLAGSALTSTVNGVASSVDLAPAVIASSTNTLTNPLNTITSTVNGIAVTAPAVNTNTSSLTGSTLTTTVNGVAGSVDLAPAVAASTTVSNASAANVSTVTVNGVTSTGAPIVNSNVLSSSGNSVTSTVNGVASNAIDLTSVIAAGTTNALSLAGNTLTSNVNGVSSTSNAVSGVSNTLVGKDLSTTVNGVTGATVDLTPALAAATTHTLSSAVNTITSVVNGVSVTAPAVNTNTLAATNGNLISTVNGVATTPAVPVLISASNGLTATNGDVKLGGTLTAPTIIATTAANTLTLSGLQSGTSTNLLLSVDAAGVISTRAGFVPGIMVLGGVDPAVNVATRLANGKQYIFKQTGLVKNTISMASYSSATSTASLPAGTYIMTFSYEGSLAAGNWKTSYFFDFPIDGNDPSTSNNNNTNKVRIHSNSLTANVVFGGSITYTTTLTAPKNVVFHIGYGQGGNEGLGDTVTFNPGCQLTIQQL